MQAFLNAQVFTYCRVYTTDQTTNNQVQEIAEADFDVTPSRTIVETASETVSASERQGFRNLLNKLESGDVPVVTKLDRLGLHAMDVRLTMEALTKLRVRVHSLALGGIGLTSAAGKMTTGVIAAVAKFERDLFIARTQTGVDRAKTLGRPQSLSQLQGDDLRKRVTFVESIAALPRSFGTGRQTVMQARGTVINSYLVG